VNRAGKICLHRDAKAYVGPETGSLLTEMLHQIRSANPFRKSRVIVNLSGGGKLASHLQTCIQNRTQICPGCIYGSSVTGRTGTNYETFYLFRP